MGGLKFCLGPADNSQKQFLLATGKILDQRHDVLRIDLFLESRPSPRENNEWRPSRDPPLVAHPYRVSVHFRAFPIFHQIFTIREQKLYPFFTGQS